MKQRLLRPFPIMMLLIAAAVIAMGVWHIVRLNQVNRNFVRSPEAENWNLLSANNGLSKLKKSEFQQKVAGVEEPLTFTLSYPLKYKQFGIPESVPKGTEITSDFVSYSIKGFGSVKRVVALTINGKEKAISLPAKTLAKLYQSALKQNGRTADFARDYGAPLTRWTARDALRTIDAQIYDAGLYIPQDYPFDKTFWENVIVLCLFCGPLAAFLLATLLSLAAAAYEYQQFLRRYNREKKEKWDDIAGTLPEFRSLKESGISMDARVMPKKPSFRAAAKGLFGPVTKEK